MHATAPQDRIPTSQKVGYGFGSFLDMWGHWLYQSLAFHVFNIGLKVSPGLISTALGVKILVDAVSDAMFGWVSDNTRSRWGRRRPFILIGGVLSGIGLPLMFAVGRGWTEMEYFWFMLVSLVLYVPVMSCFNMPWVSLGSEMTPDYHERTRLMATKMAIQKIPELAMFGAAQFTTLAWFHDASGKPDVLQGAQVYTTILGAVMIILSILIFSMTRERYYDRVVAQSGERVPFKDTLYRTLKNRGFRRVLGMMLAYMMATAMVGTLGYYATVYYVCKGDVEMGAKWNTLMGISGMVFGLAGIPFSVWLSKRVGKRNALLVILALAIGAFIGDWFFYNPNIPWLQLFASGCVAFTGAGFWTIYGSTLADVIESDELDTGLRREGSFSACASWISKAGLALGNLGSGWVLQFTGFNADLPAQSDEAIFLMRVFLSGIPAVGLLLAIIVIAGFSLTEKRMYEIRNELEARRGAV